MQQLEDEQIYKKDGSRNISQKGSSVQHPIFCGYDILDIQDRVSYTESPKKEVLIHSYSSYSSNREMAFPGDTLVCHGEIRGSTEKDGVNLIDCRVWVENQTGRILADGSATISLP